MTRKSIITDCCLSLQLFFIIHLVSLFFKERSSVKSNCFLGLKNRQVYHEFFIDAKYEAGMVLLGTEVKSLRDGRASFNDSYCLFDKGELYVKSLHISEYAFGILQKISKNHQIKSHRPKRKKLISDDEARNFILKTDDL